MIIFQIRLTQFSQLLQLLQKETALHEANWLPCCIFTGHFGGRPAIGFLSQFSLVLHPLTGQSFCYRRPDTFHVLSGGDWEPGTRRTS